MSENTFQLNFVVNNDASRQALQEEQREYKVLEQLADMVAKKIGSIRDAEAERQKNNLRQVMTAEEVAAAAKMRLIDMTNQRAIAAAVAQMDASKKQEQAQRSANDAARSFAGTLQTVIGAVGGITSVAGAVGYVATQFKEVQQQAIKAALEVSGYREKLRELAGIKGVQSPDADTLRKELGFRRDTLQSSGDAIKLQESALGMAAAVVGPGRKLSEAEFDKFLRGAGQLQVARDVDPTAMGGLAGAMALNTKGPMDGDLLRRQLLAQFKVADLGAMTSAQFSDQFSKAAPLVGAGDFKNLQELGAVMSGMSFGGKDTVGERMRQLVRLTRGSLNDVSAPPGAAMSPAEYYRSIGANDQQDTRKILEMVSKDVQSQEAVAKRQGKTLSIDTYLRQRGFGSTEDIGAFKQYYNFRDQINQTFIPQAYNLPTSEQANKQLNAFKATPLGFKQQAELQRDMTSVAMGAGPGEYADAYKRDLFERLKVRDQGTLFGWKGEFDSTTGILGSGMFRTEMIEDLRRKGLAAGLDWTPKPIPGDQEGGRLDPLQALISGRPGSPEESQGLTRAIQMISERGGSPLGSPEAIKALEQQLDVTKRLEEHMRKVAEAATPQVLQGKPGGKGGGNRLP